MWADQQLGRTWPHTPGGSRHPHERSTDASIQNLDAAALLHALISLSVRPPLVWELPPPAVPLAVADDRTPETAAVLNRRR